MRVTARIVVGLARRGAGHLVLQPKDVSVSLDRTRFTLMRPPKIEFGKKLLDVFFVKPLFQQKQIALVAVFEQIAHGVMHGFEQKRREFAALFGGLQKVGGKAQNGPAAALERLFFVFGVFKHITFGVARPNL